MTTLGVIALIVLVIGLLVLIGSTIDGLLTYSHERAQAIRDAEADAEATQVRERIVMMRAAYPEIVKGDRLDWHPYFLLPHIAVVGYAISMFAGAKLTNNVAALGEATRYTMATCFIVGASMVLGSSLMGVRWGKLSVGCKVRDHLTSAALGDDIVLPYRISMAGQFAVSVSMFIYSSTSFRTTSGSLGGWLTGALALACVLLAPIMFRRVRYFQKWEAILIDVALEELERERRGD